MTQFKFYKSQIVLISLVSLTQEINNQMKWTQGSLLRSFMFYFLPFTHI